MRVCLLGVSHWHASMHLDAVRSSDGEVIAVWDQDMRAGASFAAAHGLTACRSMEHALAGKPDLVVLMGSPQGVPDLALEVVAADIPLILEKPAASTTGGLMLIVEAVRRCG